MKSRLLPLALGLITATLTPGCHINMGEEETAVKPVWDLRTSHTVDDIGWPESHDGSTYKVDPSPGELTILLPEEISVEGPFDVIANRPFRRDEQADRGQLEYLVINYDREAVADAARRAAELSRRWGIDGSKLAEWGIRNADGVDLSAGGAMESTGSKSLTDAGPSLSIKARAFGEDQAYLSVTVSWDTAAPESGP